MALPRIVVVALMVATAACTAGPAALPSPTPSPPASPTPSPLPSAAPTPRFGVNRAQAHVAELAREPRETGGAGYRRAARYVAQQLEAMGYDTSEQLFNVPAGTNDSIAVPEGTSLNVVATAPGFRPGRAHLIVGAHLDTVPDSPGANDNASGVAVMLELARLAVREPPSLPVVFVALGAEERRRFPGTDDSYSLGARAYLDATTAREREAVQGFLNIDMVGNGRRVLVNGSGRPLSHAVNTAKRQGVPYGLAATPLYSDHTTFQDAGIASVWFWSGEHDSWHTPADTAEVVTDAALRRTGRLAWETLRTFEP